jgi:hypothetical protein
MGLIQAGELGPHAIHDLDQLVDSGIGNEWLLAEGPNFASKPA